MRIKRTQYRTKVTDDNGLTRGKVPSPLLRQIGARTGDYMLFRLEEDRVRLRLSRSRKKGARGSSRKATKV